MSSFTAPLQIEAIRSQRTGWRRWLPPGWVRPRWRILSGFDYAVGSVETPVEIITVPAGFEFDGASVPMLFRFLIPLAHPDMMQVAALHDWLYRQRDHPRRRADLIMREAMTVLDLAPLWRDATYFAVRLGGGRNYARSDATAD